MEGKSLEIQLTSPAMNLVGFEHKANDPKDIAAVENATSLLREHDDHIQNDNHSEIVANYQYSCGNTASLPSMTVALFESFPGIHKIHVMWVKQTQQGAATLTPKNHIIKFR